MARQSANRQRGVALFVVMIMVLLSTLLVLWASRTSLLNEAVTGNDSDYQRALEAAQALLRDAELDIKGQLADGSPCDKVAGCRLWAPTIDLANKNLHFPTTKGELNDFQAALGAQKPSCAAGICVPDNLSPAFWTDPKTLTSMISRAARYGDHTGATAVAGGNRLLLPSNDQAWYWIELLPPGTSVGGGPATLFAPHANRPYFYRITAAARGSKPSTLAVVQSVVFWTTP